MNFADSEIVNSILIEDGMTVADTPEMADVILVNTCSIRENAETKVWNRLKELRTLKKTNSELTVGVLGCMAERIKDRIIEKEHLVDIGVGPDAYRDIPRLLAEVDDGRKAVNVLLSLEETYADITFLQHPTTRTNCFNTLLRS